MEEINLVATKRHGLDLIEVAHYARLVITFKTYSATRGRKQKIFQPTIYSASLDTKKQFQKYRFLDLTMEFLLNDPRVIKHLHS